MMWRKGNSFCLFVLFCSVLGIESITLCMVDQCSTTKLHHWPLKLLYDADVYIDYGENYGSNSNKPEKRSLYDPEIVLLGIYLEEIGSICGGNTYIHSWCGTVHSG